MTSPLPGSISPTLSIAIPDSGSPISPSSPKENEGRTESGDGRFARQKAAKAKRGARSSTEGFTTSPTHRSRVGQRKAVKEKQQLAKQMGVLYPLRILVVEDNLVNQKVIVRMLQHYGYQCTLANDGIESLEALRKAKFDVVFMDMQMPRMGGLEACQHIRVEFPATDQPRIIALTANVLQKERESCLSAGMDDFISKPLEIQQLYLALIRSIPTHASNAGSSTTTTSTISSASSTSTSASSTSATSATSTSSTSSTSTSESDTPSTETTRSNSRRNSTDQSKNSQRRNSGGTISRISLRRNSKPMAISSTRTPSPLLRSQATSSLDEASRMNRRRLAISPETTYGLRVLGDESHFNQNSQKTEIDDGLLGLTVRVSPPFTEEERNIGIELEEV